MTQKQQFDQFGCACRCLIALANANKKSNLTIEGFIETFAKKYPCWERYQKCGLTDTSMVLDMARSLGLADSCQVFINKDKVRDALINQKVLGVLLFTEKTREANNSFVDYFHCWVVDSTLADGGRFRSFHVNNDLGLSYTDLDDSDIDQLRGYFLLLYPKLDVSIESL